MKMIVGLGNPGSEFTNTRHNVGFMAIDKIASFLSVNIDKNKFCGLYTQIEYNGEKVILLKPQKFMNLSGEVIQKFVHFFKLEVEDILIISDDLDLSVGTIKLKYKGSSGGHNGLKDIERNIGTKEYKRLKIGIAKQKSLDTKNYVLGKFKKEEKDIIESLLTSMPFIFKDYISLSFDNVMNKYNKK